jgi:hypothetical protein
MSLLVGFLSEIQILTAGLAFTGKSGFQIITGLAHSPPPQMAINYIVIEIAN